MFKKAEMQNGSTAIGLRKINKGKHSVFPRRFCETMVVLTQEESFAHFKVKCVNFNETLNELNCLVKSS